jgi:hypothetical protein
MAARVHNVFSLAEILKIFLSETTKPIELLLCRNDHWTILNNLYILPIKQENQLKRLLSFISEYFKT